jgi:hypothetical protein
MEKIRVIYLAEDPGCKFRIRESSSCGAGGRRTCKGILPDDPAAGPGDGSDLPEKLVGG